MCGGGGGGGQAPAAAVRGDGRRVWACLSAVFNYVRPKIFLVVENVRKYVRKQTYLCEHNLAVFGVLPNINLPFVVTRSDLVAKNNYMGG